MRSRISLGLFVVILVGILYSFSDGVHSIGLKKEVNQPEFQTGDIIFQSSKSGQGQAIQLATKSKFSHVGMIYLMKGEPWVFEAVQPVRLIPIDQFIAQGDGEDYVVSRLKDAETILNVHVIEKMHEQIEKHVGKSYDIHFDWSDDRMYCSELVWKIYKQCTGLEIGVLKPLKAYDLTHPVVKQTMEKRYGENIPWDEPMISPGAIFESEHFTVIRDTKC